MTRTLHDRLRRGQPRNLHSRAWSITTAAVWPEATDLMTAAQPFAQTGGEVNALPVLRGLGGTDKHRNLVLCAAAAFSVNAILPSGKGHWS
jgi:hypothetical protein